MSLLPLSQRSRFRRHAIFVLTGLVTFSIYLRCPSTPEQASSLVIQEPVSKPIPESIPMPESILDTVPYPVPDPKALVVASQQKDDTDWIHDHFPDWKVYRYIVDNTSAQYTVPQNKGREAMVYLTYIIDFYNNLPDITVFMHSERYQWHNDDPLYDYIPLLQNLQLPYVATQGYANLRCVWTIGCPSEINIENINDKDKETQIVYFEAFKELFPNVSVPSIVGVACCSQIALTREKIHERSLDEYRGYREWLLNTALSDDVSGRVLEYSWHMIFGKPTVHCPSAKECYCNTFGLCNLECGDDGKCGNRWPFPPSASLPKGWPEIGWDGESRDQEVLEKFRNEAISSMNETGS